MHPIRRKLLVPLILSGFACEGAPRRPSAEPTACASTTDDQTLDCARLHARFVYATGQPVGVAFVTLDHVSDSARYRVAARLGFEAGYCDQPHFIHDSRDLSGLTPAEYAAKRSSVGEGFVPHLRVACSFDGNVA